MDFTVDMLEISQMIENGKKQQKEIDQRRKEKQQEKRQQKKESIVIILITIAFFACVIALFVKVSHDHDKAITNCINRGYSSNYCERLAQ